MQQITRSSLTTLQRFPATLAAAAAGTLAGITLAQDIGTSPDTFALRVLFAALLAVPLTLVFRLVAEKREIGRGGGLLLQVMGLVLPVLYAWTLPGNLSNAPEMHAIRLAMLVTGAMLLVSVLPWTGKGEGNGFWQYNKTLFLRLLTAGLFAHVLYAGLAIALAAIENLFELEVPGQRYAQLWMLLVGVFMPWFFLAGIPQRLSELHEATDYPKGLKIFAQYVVFPLVVIYLVILIAYSGKIIIEWSWPNGWVSRLILGFAGAGLFFMLLMHPIREQLENRWVRTALQWFNIALLPLLVLYFLAVLRRLSDYGLTEGRYLAIVLGIWLLLITLYLLLSRVKNIRLIPASMCALAFLVSFGPWGAFSVSEQSQIMRFLHILDQQHMLKDGHAVQADAELPAEATQEISAILQYLHNVHGFAGIQQYFTASLREDDADEGANWKDATDVAALIGVEFALAPRAEPGGRRSYEARFSDAMQVDGYRWVLPEYTFHRRGNLHSIRLTGFEYRMSEKLDTLTVLAEAPVADTLVIPLQEFFTALSEEYHTVSALEIPLERMTATAEGSRLRVKLYMPWIRLQRNEGSLKIENLRLRAVCGEVSPQEIPPQEMP